MFVIVVTLDEGYRAMAVGHANKKLNCPSLQVDYVEDKQNNSLNYDLHLTF